MWVWLEMILTPKGWFSLTKNQNVSISSDCVNDSVVYDPVKSRLSQSEAEAEEAANCKVWNQTLSLVYSSDSVCDSDNAVFT